MNIDSNMRRILITMGFLDNEIECVKEHLLTKELGRIRLDLMRVQRNMKDCWDYSSVSKESREVIADTILEFQDVVDNVLSATPEQLMKIKEILEE